MATAARAAAEHPRTRIGQCQQPVETSRRHRLAAGLAGRGCRDHQRGRPPASTPVHRRQPCCAVGWCRRARQRRPHPDRHPAGPRRVDERGGVPPGTEPRPWHAGQPDHAERRGIRVRRRDRIGWAA